MTQTFPSDSILSGVLEGAALHFDRRGIFFTSKGIAGRIETGVDRRRLFLNVIAQWRKYSEHPVALLRAWDATGLDGDWFCLRPDKPNHWQGGCWDRSGRLVETWSFDEEAFVPSRDRGPLRDLAKAAAGMIVLEKYALPEFVHGALTPEELECYASMGKKRGEDFFAGRIALKILTDRMTPSPDKRPSHLIETTDSENGKRVCMAGWHYSLAHDNRFAVAVFNERALGVDVEKKDERMIRCLDRYCARHEKALLKESPLGELDSAARLWTGKEAAAKAWNRSMFWSWKNCRFLSLGSGESQVMVEQKRYRIIHVEADLHVFSMLKREKQESS